MKKYIKKFILRDECDSQWDDLIEFDKEVLYADVWEKIYNVRNNIEDYTNEDIYKALEELGSYKITWLGDYEIITY